MGDVDLCIKTAAGDSKKLRSELSTVAPMYNDLVDTLVTEAMTKAAETAGVSQTEGDIFIVELESSLVEIETRLKQYKQEYDGLKEKKNGSKVAATPHTKEQSSLNGLDQVVLSEVKDEEKSCTSDFGSDFGNIKSENYSVARDFLINHPEIMTESQRLRDELSLKAFEEALADNMEKARQLVHNELLVGYCTDLEPAKIDRLFHCIADPKHPARAAFLEEVGSTMLYIQKRCQILKLGETSLRSEGKENEML